MRKPRGLVPTRLIHEVQRSLTTLVFGGVFERFPKLRIVSAENDIGWLPHYMYRMDHAYEKFGAMLGEHRSRCSRATTCGARSGRPSRTIRSARAPTSFFGADNYMWASDFPHTDSTFPESRAWIERNFAGVPDGGHAQDRV